MIIYNIRKNGPYEKDKFILNIGQLHNKVMDEQENFEKSDIHLQLKALNNLIREYTKEDSLANQMALIEKECDESIYEQ